MTYQHTMRSCYLASVTQAAVVNLAPILFVIFQTEFGLTYQQIGALSLINFLTQLLVDALAIKTLDKVGYRPAAIGSCACSALGFILLAVCPAVWPGQFFALCLPVVIYAIGGGLAEVIVSPIADSLPTGNKQGSMALVHGAYSWGQAAVVLLSTCALAIIGHARWQWLPLAWAILPLYNMFLFFRIPLMPTIPDKHRTPLRNLLKDCTLWLFLLVMLCAGAAEQAMSQWSSLFAESALGVNKVLGDIAGPCLFAVFMGLGRTGFGMFGAKWKLDNILLLCALLAVACYLTAAFFPHPMISLAACALTGLAVSLMWPGTVSLSAAAFPLGGAALFAFLALFGDLGCSAGPWLTGVISDMTAVSNPDMALRAGLAAGAIFPLLLFITILLLKGLHKREGAK